MTRERLLAAAAVFALAATLLNQHAAAQQSEGAQPTSATESASADTSASSDQSSSTSDTQSDTQSSTAQSSQSQSSSADNQSSSTGTQSSGKTSSNTTNQSDNQSTATADNQTTASGTASSQTDGAAASQDAAASASGQTATDVQESAPPVPAPSNADNQSANQPGDRANQFDRSTNRIDASATGRTDVNAQGRLDANARTRSDRQTDLRAGIHFGQATNRGLVIDRIDNNSFYHTSGFRRGDIIVSLHGRPIRSEADFVRFVALYPGQRIPVVVLRGGQRETIYVQYPDQVVHSTNRMYGPAQAGGAYLGVIFDAQARDAAVVLRVNPGSPAEEAGLQAGDLMLALNGQEVRSYPQAISIIRSMQPGQELEIIVDRARNEQQIVAVLDAQPNVRTATRPGDVIIDRQTVPAGVDVEVYRENPNRGVLGRDRDVNRDGYRDRRLLPRRN